jgi:Ca2+-binding EF-hand superfamily protein
LTEKEKVIEHNKLMRERLDKRWEVLVMADYKRAFWLYDKDGDGQIGIEEFKRKFKHIGFGADQYINGFIEEIFRRYDTDGDELLGFDEFVQMCIIEKPFLNDEMCDKSHELFELWDTDGDGNLGIKMINR